jgi:hypothetical protein
MTSSAVGRSPNSTRPGPRFCTVAAVVAPGLRAGLSEQGLHEAARNAEAVEAEKWKTENPEKWSA